jgi:hypothetical protein
MAEMSELQEDGRVAPWLQGHHLPLQKRVVLRLCYRLEELHLSSMATRSPAESSFSRCRARSHTITHS